MLSIIMRFQYWMAWLVLHISLPHTQARPRKTIRAQYNTYWNPCLLFIPILIVKENCYSATSIPYYMSYKAQPLSPTHTQWVCVCARVCTCVCDVWTNREETSIWHKLPLQYVISFPWKPSTQTAICFRAYLLSAGERTINLADNNRQRLAIKTGLKQ